jgi:putative membrane protein
MHGTIAAFRPNAPQASMTLEAILAYLHLLAILTMVVFIASEAALCRVQWLNAAVVERLARVDQVYAVAAVAVLATGVARTWWGVKGTSWYWTNPLLHIKLTLFVIIGLMSIRPTITFIRWRKQLRAGGALPGQAEIGRTRRLVLIQAHLIAVVPLAAVFLARGFGK